MKPLAVDLCCGLGGWTDGLLAEGWDVVGFDVEQHIYGEHRYPAQLVLQDILTLDGRQFRGKVSLIVASPPCQKYSYMAMPWKRAKDLAVWYRDPAHPERLGELTALFDACVRIGREAECPIVIENVRGAQPWVGRSKWNFGSYHLFGDVPALMPFTHRAVKAGGLDWNKRIPGQAFNTHAEKATKNDGGSWFAVAHNTTSGKGQNPDGRLANNARDALVDEMRGPRGGKVRHDPRYPHLDPNHPEYADGVKGVGIGSASWQKKEDRHPDDPRNFYSKSSARKAASARIAKIPFALASHIARVYRPESLAGAA